MPIYAYRCESCGHAMDVLRKVSDPVLTTCPACGAEALRKQVTAAGFQLKGSGWYVTDFKGESKPPATDAKPADQSGSANGGDARPSQPAAPAQDGAKAETKPAPAPAAAAGTPAPGKASASGAPPKPSQ
ncbi:MAG: zinc ribbon domain-containing protein [Burkholderiaceae bacterium]|nr:zinc ribbon domain-containing protein [Burkholderiaceae bacterium]